ncbi:MAG: hypothetical protein FIB08_04195 [Candidatus Methanoperedens sp.]|nr:hypothetical protein [Candidatus Methanoperedens sp.]
MLNKFFEWQKANGLKASTIVNYNAYLTPMNEFKNLDKWTKKDAIRYILKFRETKKPSTVETAKIIMKVYFKWLKKLEIVDDIKIKNIKNNLKRDDILTIDDINTLIKATDSHLYKALIALLFESGGRIDEILNILVKDIQETDKGMIISIPQTKTGNDFRRILCVFSAGYIRNYLSYCALNKEDKLFNLSKVAVWRFCKRIAKAANINKPISAHKFRHAQATDMVLRGYQESLIKKKLGWTDDSRMIARYTHIADDDVINATAEMACSSIDKKPIEIIEKAESFKIADASLQLSKLSEENEALKAKLAEYEKKFESKMADIETRLKGFQVIEHTNDGLMDVTKLKYKKEG